MVKYHGKSCFLLELEKENSIIPQDISSVHWDSFPSLLLNWLHATDVLMIRSQRYTHLCNRCRLLLSRIIFLHLGCCMNTFVIRVIWQFSFVPGEESYFSSMLSILVSLNHMSTHWGCSYSQWLCPAATLCPMFLRPAGWTLLVSSGVSFMFYSISKRREPEATKIWCVSSHPGVFKQGC